jgi:sigma-B regulation protein RsbU (phosphoserine phosphatase)
MDELLKQIDSKIGVIQSLERPLRIGRILMWDAVIVAVGMILPLGIFVLARYLHTLAHGACNCLQGLLLEYGPTSLMTALAVTGVLWVLTRRNRARLSVERQLRHTNERMKSELEVAAQVQRALLPSSLPDVSTLQFGSRFRPCETLAGDIFDVFSLNHSWVGLYALDVSGHGVAAALLSVRVHRLLSPTQGRSSIVREYVDTSYKPVPPAEVFRQLNQRFPMELTTGQYFTILYGIVNIETMEFRYACAGHPAPAFLPRNRDGQVLSGEGFPVGLVRRAEYEEYDEYSIKLAAGDRLYVYSDGVTEAMDEDGKEFGKQRLVQILDSQRTASLEESLSALLEQVEKWSSGSLADDVTIVGFQLGNERT